MHPKILALDFDGVLHPCTAGTFIYTERLEIFLRQHPSIRVVFSTSWRLDYSWQELISLFSPDIRDRFVGGTPALSESTPFQRETEIHAWLREQGCAHVMWAALDDDATLFSPGCRQLVLCETLRGLRQAQLDQLAAKLQL